MSMIPTIAQAMQTVLSQVAHHAGRASGFIQRARALDGASFSQMLVFGFQANPAATLEDLVKMGAVVGVKISPQGLAQRFTEQAASCLQQVLQAAVEQVVRATPTALPLLQRFTGVYLQDSTVLPLPSALAGVWAGCGGSSSPAALKVQVQWDYLSGQVAHLELQPGRAQDKSAACQHLPLPPGSLRLADLGYFALAVIKEDLARGVFWLTRLHSSCVLFAEQTGKRLDLATVLPQESNQTAEIAVEAGCRERLPARLLAQRVPQEVADRRRARLHEQARKKGQAVSQRALALADWTLLLTTVPAERLSVREALVLARVRWQLELLFKLWKSHAHLEQVRSSQPWRILCEIYAKLIAVIVQHWLLLAGTWAWPQRSLFKAARTLRDHAAHLAAAFATHSAALLETALNVIVRCLVLGSRITKRRTDPATFQLLLDPDLWPLS